MSCDPEKLREFIEGLGLSHKQNSRSYIFDCPRCKHTQKLYMEKRNGKFKCFFCASTDRFQGRAEFALADLALMPLKEVRAFLYGANFSGTAIELDIQLSEFFGDDDVIDSDAVDIPRMAFPLDYYPIDHRHAVKGLEYLATRGIDLEMARKYHLRFAPAERRVIFPVELGDRLVGWQKRIIIPSKNWNEEQERYTETAKMLSSKDVPTAHVVMFANNLVGSGHIVVCEGPIDAIKADLCGGNVATMGKSIGQGQVRTIKDPARLTRQQLSMMWGAGIQRIYLALDPDAARETARLVRQEFSDMETYVMIPPKPYHDFGEMDYGDVYEVFKNTPREHAGKIYISLPSVGRS
jgi:hypothetical protein